MTELPHSTWSGAAPGSWLARWLAACADLEDLFAHHHLLDAIIEEVDGRRIRVGERWLIDFASCNYLGLDLDREVIEAIPAYLDQWGTHPSWSRMLGSPALYRQIETRLTELLGAGDTLLLPTLTHIHASVIPVLASDGTIFVDSRAHKTIWDGCVAARAHGATVVRYAHDDPAALERLLHRHPKAPRLVCMDGINSMTGNPPDLPAFLALARANDALLYVDDAHGFGVVGERDREEISQYGRRGNGVVRHLGQSYDHVVLTGGFSKAYSSLLAFVACPPELKRLLKVTAPPYLYSGPSPVASLASVLVGLQVNEARGDDLRAVLWSRTRRILDHLEKLGGVHPQPLRVPDRRGAPGRLRRPGQGRALPAGAGHLRHPGLLPGRAPRGGRVPHPGDRRQHRRRGHRAAGRPRPAGRRRPPPPALGRFQGTGLPRRGLSREQPGKELGGERGGDGCDAPICRAGRGPSAAAAGRVGVPLGTACPGAGPAAPTGAAGRGVLRAARRDRAGPPGRAGLAVGRGSGWSCCSGWPAWAGAARPGWSRSGRGPSWPWGSPCKRPPAARAAGSRPGR